MAQIIKHRRGRISQLKGTAARNGELIIASGSIDDLQGPFVFIGSPISSDEGVAGAFNSVSRIYQGTAAPTITAGTYGSVLDGTPFYATGNKSLYILNNSNAGGNTKIDLSGNLEGNTITGITVSNLTSSYISSSANITSINVSSSFFTGSFIGDGSKLTGVPISGVTGLDTSKILSGSYSASISELGGFQVNTDTSITGALKVHGASGGTLNVIGNSFGQIYLQSIEGALALQPGYGGVEVLGDDAHLKVNDYVTVGNSIYVTGSVYATTIEGTGSLYLQPDQGDARYFEIYNTSVGDTHIKASGGYSFFGDDTNYLKLDDGAGYTTLVGDNGVYISSNVGSVNISSYDGSSLELNTDGGEGNINLGNNSNSVWGYTTVTNFDASDYAQLGSNNSYLWVDADGAYMQQDGSSVVGFTARPNGTLEATGSLGIDGNTSITGSLVVADGSATFDQGLVAQNSNMLLTSGSNLVIQDGGNLEVAGNVYITGSEYVDNIYTRTGQGANALHLNGGTFGAPDVELTSAGNISLFAEGGSPTINVTGSIKVTGDVTIEQNMYVSGNIYQTGSFYTQGDIVLSGSINIGNSLTGDTINFGGEVNSHILPTTGATYNLGSTGQTWNNVYAQKFYGDGSNITNLPISGLTGLDQSRIISGSYSGSISEMGGFQVNTDTSVTGSLNVTGTITADIIHATNDGNGTNFQIGNDMWLGDINEANATRFMGFTNSEIAKIYLGDYSNYTYLGSDGGSVTLYSDQQLQLKSQNNAIDINAYDGNINLNTDSNNQVNIGGNTYIQNHNLYVDRIYDYSDSVNYLELYGFNTDDGYWWESGNGNDTTLLNNVNNNNLNILQTNSGDVNIDATGGSVNLHSNNGFNVTGSMIVSDGSGVFNSSLIVNNSDLTLDGGSNIHMNDGAHLYFDTCVDMYYDGGTDNFVFYNDCNAFSFQNDTSFTGSINVSNGIYVDIIYGRNHSNNALHLNNGAYGAPDVELSSATQISLFSEGGGSSYAINMTGSVHMLDSADISGSLTVINNITASYFTGAFVGDGSQLVNVPSSGVTGLMLNKIYDGNVSASITEAHGFQVNTDSAFTGSVTISGSIFDVYSTTHIHNDLYVSGNLQILGSGTTVHISSSQIDIGTNIINLNTYAPFERFAGISVYDSGSNVGVTGSILWDSTNNVWIYSNPTGSDYVSARFISGPQNSGSLGEEQGLTVNYLTKAVGDDHIGDSLLFDDGTIFTYNTNKFIVTGSTGDTYINGNVTINGAGGTDLAGGSSWVTFRNDDGILGFIDSTDTEDETSQLLGYRTSDGALVFSSLVDGGTY